MSVILTARGINVRYNDRVILDGVALAVEERDRIGLVGHNGSGKSTLLNILAGRQTPDAGEITPRRNLVIGYLAQEFTLDPKLTVVDSVRESARRVLRLIEEFESPVPRLYSVHPDWLAF